MKNLTFFLSRRSCFRNWFSFQDFSKWIPEDILKNNIFSGFFLKIVFLIPSTKLMTSRKMPNFPILFKFSWGFSCLLSCLFNTLLVYSLLKRNKTKNVAPHSTFCVKNALCIQTQLWVWVHEAVKLHHDYISLGFPLLRFTESLIWAYY